MFYPYLLFFPFLFFHVKGDCESEDRSIFLWSIRKEEIGAQGYLFGTIHVPYTEVWDRVSDRVREAFAASDTVLLEVDLNNEETLRKLVRCKKLPRKQTALSYLPPELFAKIKTFMSKFRQQLIHASVSHPMMAEDTVQHVQQVFDNLAGNWHRKRPEWLLFTLYQLCENLLDRSTAPMLDVYLATKALEKEKRLEAIETAEEQCNPVSNIPLDDTIMGLFIRERREAVAPNGSAQKGADPQGICMIVFSIGYTLHFLEKMYFGSGLKKERSLSELIENYRCGSLESQLINASDYDQKIPGIPSQEKERARNIDLNLKEDIITKRNIRMAKRIDQMINANPQRIIFTAIGTGHFLGEKSILEHLYQLGYTVEPVKDNDTISARKKTKVKSLWTRDFIPKPPLVVIEYINSTASYGLLWHLICILLLRRGFVPNIFVFSSLLLGVILEMSDDDPMAGRTTVFHYFILPHNRRIKMIRRPLIRHSIDVSGDTSACLYDMAAYRQGPFDNLCASEKHKRQKSQSCGDVSHTHQPDVPMEEQK